MGDKSENEKMRGNRLKMHGNVRKLYFFDFWRPFHGSKGAFMTCKYFLRFFLLFPHIFAFFHFSPPRIKKKHPVPIIDPAPDGGVFFKPSLRYVCGT